jgi:hypothetical protein
LREEILDYAGYVALEENAGQMRLSPPNTPNRVIIDNVAVDLSPVQVSRLRNVTNATIEGIRRKVTFTYVDLEVFAAAVQLAWLELNKRMRVRGGAAKRSVYVWCADARVRNRSGKHSSIRSVLQWIEASGHMEISVHIIGPTLEYRRGIVYNPRGKPYTALWQTQTRQPAGQSFSDLDRRQIRQYFASIRSRLAVKAVHLGVVRKVKPKFKDIKVRYLFTRSKETLPIKSRWTPDRRNIHVPVIFLAPKFPTGYGRRR